MILAFGRISWISPTYSQLFGILSMKNGAAVLRWTRVDCEVALAERAQLVAGPSAATASKNGASLLVLRAVARSRAICGMSGSSMVPSTSEWLDRICSSSVEPARGRPTMKIGSADPAPQPARAAKKLGRILPLAALDVLGVLLPALYGCRRLRIALPSA